MSLDWSDIPLLVALAEKRTMSLAARHAGVDVSTISRRLAAAERALGVRLFVREDGAYRCTDAGSLFVHHAVAVIARVETMLLDTRAAVDAMAGPVRLTAIDALFTHWLGEHLPRLYRAHPRLEMVLLASNDDLSFARNEADLALRLSRPTADASLRMRKVGVLGFAVYGHARAFKGVTADAYRGSPWVGYSADLDRLPEMRWLRNAGAHFVLRSSSMAALTTACEAGVGLALLPCIVGDRLVGVKRIEAKPVLQRDLWLLTHRDSGLVARFAYVADWLARLCESDAAALRGDSAARSGATAAPGSLPAA